MVPAPVAGDGDEDGDGAPAAAARVGVAGDDPDEQPDVMQDPGQGQCDGADTNDGRRQTGLEHGPGPLTHSEQSMPPRSAG